LEISSEIWENVLKNALNFLLIGIVLSNWFYISPIEAHSGLLSINVAGEGISSAGSRFSEKRAITTETAHLAPIPWISFEREINNEFAVADRIILGRKMRGEIGSESDIDCFYVEVSSIMNISFKLETSSGLLIPSSDIRVTVYADDHETILGAFISSKSKPREINMGLLPGTYNILINRLPTSPFGKDLTYDLTVEPFCTLACWNSLKRFDRYSGEYGLVYEHESLGYTQLPNKADEYYGGTVEGAVIGENIDAFGYEMVHEGVLNVEFWTSGRSYGKTETLLQSIVTVEIFKNEDGVWIVIEKFNSISNELITRNLDVKKGTYLVGISVGGIAEKNMKYYLKVIEDEETAVEDDSWGQIKFRSSRSGR
jgi:hypothetical protein